MKIQPLKSRRASIIRPRAYECQRFEQIRRRVHFRVRPSPIPRRSRRPPPENRRRRDRVRFSYRRGRGAAGQPEFRRPKFPAADAEVRGRRLAPARMEADGVRSRAVDGGEEARSSAAAAHLVVMVHGILGWFVSSSFSDLLLLCFRNGIVCISGLFG